MTVDWFNNACRCLVLGITLTGLAACGNEAAAPRGSALAAITQETPATMDRRCDTAAFPSTVWLQCELANYRAATAAESEWANPAFAERWRAQSDANLQGYLMRNAADSSWLKGGSAACASWSGPCVGDPYRYPEAPGPDGRHFYAQEAVVMPVVFYDRDCARISGRVWAPRAGQARLPGVVIEPGAGQAPETAYWWMAQALVRAGYEVLTFDVRGQGRSDAWSPSGKSGSNLNVPVFWEGLVDAVDFFQASPSRPYAHQKTCAGTYPTPTDSHNPLHERLDPERLGVAGHSKGGMGALVAQSFDAAGASAWPGRSNPVKAVLAWDAPCDPSDYVEPINSAIAVALSGVSEPIVPRVPLLDLRSEYCLVPAPFATPPDPEAHQGLLQAWRGAGVPVVQVTLQASTHFEFSLMPLLPASSWCPGPASGACAGAAGNAQAQYYSLAWLDRWLKRPGETGYDSADARLLDDGGPEGAAKMSFRFHSSRDFPERLGASHRCESIRDGC